MQTRKKQAGQRQESHKNEKNEFLETIEGL